MCFGTLCLFCLFYRGLISDEAESLIWGDDDTDNVHDDTDNVHDDTDNVHDDTDNVC